VSALKISAFVICYNRADTIGTCLRALRFADELIVVDKSSTDGSRSIALRYADQVHSVPWTPTVEETRAAALALCRHEWILFLDDDECLGARVAAWIHAELEKPQGDIYEFALRHYILGRHDECAYYWPEHHLRLFRRGAVTFSSTIHSGIQCHSDRVVRLPFAADLSIHHFSNADVAGWIEKTNRYTANPDRVGVRAGPEGLSTFAHQRIDHWFRQTRGKDGNGYPAAAALMRAVYDMVDALKAWEEEGGADGAALMREARERLDAELMHPPTVLPREQRNDRGRKVETGSFRLRRVALRQLIGYFRSQI
jgi:glycosyltransferase involved in cell wall biosynthesis